MHLRRKLGKVLYIDVDIHHCDGVTDAFRNTEKITCVSLHRYQPGFYPGTGEGKFKGFNVMDIPLPLRCTDDVFVDVYTSMINTVLSLNNDASEPSTAEPFKCIVLAVGADGIKNDRLVSDQGWSLTSFSLSKITSLTCKLSKKHNLPILILGGGGYTPENYARTLTACTVGAAESYIPDLLKSVPEYVPDSDQYGDRYKPDFRMHTSSGPSKVCDMSITKDMDQVLEGRNDAMNIIKRYEKLWKGRYGGFQYDHDDECEGKGEDKIEFEKSEDEKSCGEVASNSEMQGECANWEGGQADSINNDVIVSGTSEMHGKEEHAEQNHQQQQQQQQQQLANFSPHKRACTKLESVEVK